MDVVIFGVGETADVFHYYLTHESPHDVIAFTADEEFMVTDSHLDLPVIPFHELQPQRDVRLFVASSFKRHNAQREEIVARVARRGFLMTSYLSPRAWAPHDIVLRPNTFIMENNVIQPYVEIGENVIIWSGNHIGHHTMIGNNCFIASHAVISGHVRIGDNTFVGVNATIRDNVTIGKRCIIGAGALVLHDVPDDSVVRGHESIVYLGSTVA